MGWFKLVIIALQKNSTEPLLPPIVAKKECFVTQHSLRPVCRVSPLPSLGSMCRESSNTKETSLHSIRPGLATCKGSSPIHFHTLSPYLASQASVQLMLKAPKGMAPFPNATPWINCVTEATINFSPWQVPTVALLSHEKVSLSALAYQCYFWVINLHHDYIALCCTASWMSSQFKVRGSIW